MTIRVVEKSKPTPVGPYELKELTPYRIVECRDLVAVGDIDDIVLKFPCNNGLAIFNVTQNKMRWYNNIQDYSFRCLRALHIQSISFCEDDEQRPE